MKDYGSMYERVDRGDSKKRKSTLLELLECMITPFIKVFFLNQKFQIVLRNDQLTNIYKGNFVAVEVKLI